MSVSDTPAAAPPPAGQPAQPALPGTAPASPPPAAPAPAPAPEAAAPPKDDGSAKELAALRKVNEKLAKDIETLRAAAGTGDALKQQLLEVLGGGKKDDPVQLLEQTRAQATALAGTARRLVLENALHHAAKDAYNVGDLLRHFGDAEVDIASGIIKDPVALNEKLAAMRAAPDTEHLFRKASAQAAPAASPGTGRPMPPAHPPAPTPAAPTGQPPVTTPPMTAQEYRERIKRMSPVDRQKLFDSLPPPGSQH